MAIENSVRLDILLVLQQRFQALDEAQHGVKFSLVELGPLGMPDHTRRITMGIVPGREVKQKLSRATNATLPVDFEFQITVNKGDAQPLVLGERVLSVVQNVIENMDDLDGWIMSIQEYSNTLDLDTYNDRTVSGVVQTNVQYRHNEKDVTRQDLTA